MPPDTDPEFPPLVLTFAATDPSGGAGLQADILTLASMGCHPLSVVTAITVQDTMGVDGVQALDAEWVTDQARSLLEDMPVDAFKIGVVWAASRVIAAIAEIVSDYPDVPLILDPVLASGRGDEFATDDMIHALRELLLPQTTILTPNSIEARRLAEVEDDEDTALGTCAGRLIEMGAEFVLVTGTHEATRDVVNTLYGKSGVVRTDSWPRLPGSYHGSGCTLASAIAAMLANGLELAGGRARGAGLHVARAQEGIPSRDGPVSSRPLVLGARGRRCARRRDRRAARRRCRPYPLTTAISLRRARARRIAGLYAITPDLADVADLAARVGAALAGGAAAVQYRNKTADAACRRDAGRGARADPRRARRALHRQRRPRARRGGRRRRRARGRGRRRRRDGARDRRSRSHRRRLLLRRFRAQAQAAVAAGADYVAFGSFFPSTVKPDARRADIELLAQARIFAVPVVAIGGITAANAPTLFRAGADAVAVISAVFDAPDVEAAARAIAAACPQPRFSSARAVHE